MGHNWDNIILVGNIDGKVGTKSSYLGLLPRYPGTPNRVGSDPGFARVRFSREFFLKLDTFRCDNRPLRPSRVAPVRLSGRIGWSIFSEFLELGSNLSNFF